MKYLDFNWTKINGLVIFVAIHLIKSLKCDEQESVKNETKLEKEIGSNTDDDGLTQEITTFINMLHEQQKCQCPCKNVPKSSVCGKATNGQLKTFDSQCHLICHNQCGSAERYAIIYHHECPILPMTNRKNVFNYIDDNRRTDHLSSGAYSSIIIPVEWQCDCAYCPETRWIRFDYYPICAERGGQKITFESWCHFDCENKCVKHTGYAYMYLYKGACEQDLQQQEYSYTEEANKFFVPKDYTTGNTPQCDACSVRCKDYYEPVCAKNGKNEHLSFKSRCHMRCHIQCYHEKSDSYVEVYEGHCPWLSS
ncbi:uncharacterized protein LOC135838821 [Planococcus citri]|uniref:uncharacterized protein LOC135838821 n=1 Tax=Planococcus citri TaxID=170843 RepID=UPI0031FA02C0